jgi:hypothetical protein
MIEQPVADHREAAHQRASRVAPQSLVSDSEEHRPQQHRQQAVRDRVVHEVEESAERRPMTTRSTLSATASAAVNDELRRRNSGPSERRGNLSGSEGEREMPDEHGVLQ